jgi:hypothetical protein
MATIHNGFIDRKFHDSFKDTGLNDVDISTTKMYKGVKPMWKQLGFDSNNKDRPNNLFYWNNIIPRNYTFENITGISTNDVLVPEEVLQPEEGDGVGIVGGSRTPRTSYREITLPENESQEWGGTNEFSQSYYYPVLPRIDKYGVFTDVINRPVVFGNRDINSWDQDDDSAPITNLVEVDENLILNIDFDQTTTDDLIDKTNLSKINYNQDYEMKLDKDLRVERSTQLIPDSITKDTSKQAF